MNIDKMKQLVKELNINFWKNFIHYNASYLQKKIHKNTKPHN